MKKLSKINLHNLSHAEIADRELKLLKGGAVYCISVCMDAICRCNESGDGSGNYPTSDSNADYHMSNSENEEGVSDVITNL